MDTATGGEIAVIQHSGIDGATSAYRAPAKTKQNVVGSRVSPLTSITGTPK